MTPYCFTLVSFASGSGSDFYPSPFNHKSTSIFALCRGDRVIHVAACKHNLWSRLHRLALAYFDHDNKIANDIMLTRALAAIETSNAPGLLKAAVYFGPRATRDGDDYEFRRAADNLRMIDSLESLTIQINNELIGLRLK